MAKLLSTIINGFISSVNFISGLAGSGWRISMVNGKAKAEFDDLVIRNTMTVFELLISKVRAIRGAMGITQANGKVKSVREDETNFYIAIEEEMSFVANDIVRCLEFNGSKRAYWVTVSAVNGNEITVAKAEFANMSTPAAGDELVQFGNTTDKRRQSAIYLHADENGQPAIDVMFGINKKSFDGCVKVRLGGDLPGTNGVKGFYSENGMIKGVDSTGHTVYCLYPDGTAELGAGAALFKPDKSGHIAGGAISWQWDAAKDKYVCTMGDVILQWDNLSAEAKENLKGEPGTNGENGETSYLHIKYSNDGGLTFTENNGETVGSYIGTCVDFNVDDPTDVKMYKWARIKGEDANLLPWIKDWTENTVQIGNDYLVSPRIFAGTRDEEGGALTGVAIGRGVINISENGVIKSKTGIFGVKNGQITFSIDAETGDAMYRGQLNVNDQFIVHSDGSFKSTKADVSGKITANEGSIGPLKIDKGLTYYNAETFVHITFDGTGLQSEVMGNHSIRGLCYVTEYKETAGIYGAGPANYYDNGIYIYGYAGIFEGALKFGIPVYNVDNIKVMTTSGNPFLHGAKNISIIFVNFTANSVVRLPRKGCIEGQLLTIVNDSTGNHDALIRMEDEETTIINLNSLWKWCDLIFYGNSWRMLRTNI